MKKKGIALVIVLVGIFLTLVACRTKEEQVVSPDIRGIVTNIEKGVAGNTAWILVEGDKEEDTSYDGASIRIPEEVIIEDEAGESIEIDDLWIGNAVEVWFTGPVAESAPVQAEAKKIVLLDEGIEIALEFEPQPPISLEEGSPTVDLEYKEVRDFTGAFGDDEVLIHIYRKTFEEDQEDVGSGEIYGYLEVNGKSYVLGSMASYGLNSFAIKLEDVIEGDDKEIVIDGILSSTYVQSSIIGKNQEGNWVLWLQGGSYDVVDLDEDGIDEWVATSRGSMPPFVFINRWKDNMFQVVDVGEALGVNYVRLKEEDQQWMIEAGVWKIDNNTNEATLKLRDFLYQDGKLIERRNEMDNNED